jgi:ribokinase
MPVKFMVAFQKILLLLVCFMALKKFDVFGVGQCALDYIGILKKFPSPNEKSEFHDLLIQGGGPVATALVALQRWGYKCAFSGVVGDDNFGRQILSDLEREGIDLEAVKIRKASESQFAFSMAEPESGNRTIFWRRPTGEPLLIDEISREHLLWSKSLLTDGIFPEASLALCKLARKNDIPVIVDAGSLRDGLAEILDNSDYFIASESFARDYLPGAGPEEVCRELAGHGTILSAVTLGSRGYAAFFEGTYIEAPAYAIEVIDTTGCGDIFHAGFTFGVLRSWHPARSLKYAAWAAAMVSRFTGGRTGIPDPRDWTV